ncbi:basic phospholipase A2 PA-9C-like [Mustelus asterias]
MMLVCYNSMEWLLTVYVLFLASCSLSGGMDNYAGRMRSISHMMRCLGRDNFKFDFIPYGCHCTHRKRQIVIGTPVDFIDWCCLQHQCCYKTRVGEGCNPMVHYSWSCIDGIVKCPSSSSASENMLSKSTCHVKNFVREIG